MTMMMMMMMMMMPMTMTTTTMMIMMMMMMMMMTVTIPMMMILLRPIIRSLNAFHRHIAHVRDSYYRPYYLARYNWPHSFSCAARCGKRQISCHNKRYIQSRPRTGEVQTRHEYIDTCTLLCCDYSTLWEALHVNMVEIGARFSDENVKILVSYQWIGWKRRTKMVGE